MDHKKKKKRTHKKKRISGPSNKTAAMTTNNPTHQGDNDHLPTNLLIDVTITTAARTMTGDNEEDATYPTSQFNQDDNESSSPSQTLEVEFPILVTIWDCSLMNVVAHEDADVGGKYVSGWTCGHCPCPTRAPLFMFKHVNATKVLHHVLKMPNQNIRPCKGNILYSKKVQYQALLNGAIIKKREKEMKANLISGYIDDYQDRILASHFLPHLPAM
jgi:hypothetical protein